VCGWACGQRVIRTHVVKRRRRLTRATHGLQQASAREGGGPAVNGHIAATLVHLPCAAQRRARLAGSRHSDEQQYSEAQLRPRVEQLFAVAARA